MTDLSINLPTISNEIPPDDTKIIANDDVLQNSFILQTSPSHTEVIPPVGDSNNGVVSSPCNSTKSVSTVGTATLLGLRYCNSETQTDVSPVKRCFRLMRAMAPPSLRGTCNSYQELRHKA